MTLIILTTAVVIMGMAGLIDCFRINRLQKRVAHLESVLHKRFMSQTIIEQERARQMSMHRHSSDGM